MSRRGWWLFAAMSLIWGIPYLLIKVADSGVAPPVLVLARVTIGAALLLPIAVRRRELTLLLPYWRWLILFALVEIVAPWLLLSEAETRLSSSLSGLLIASVPILVAVFGLLSGGTNGNVGSVLEVLAVAVCYSIGPLIAARKLSELPSLGMTAACLAFAAIVYAPIAAVTWPHAVPAAKVLASLATLGVISTALAFILFFALIAEAGPARATVITYVNPAVAVVLGVLVLGERLTAQMAIAFVLILGGSVLATRAAGQRARDGGDGSEQEPQTAAPAQYQHARPAGPD